MDSDDFLLFSKKTFYLIFLTRAISLIIQHAIPPGQKTWMNTAFHVFIISSFELVLKMLIIFLMEINYPIL